MRRQALFLSIFTAAQVRSAYTLSTRNSIVIAPAPPANSSILPESFVSFSIEFSSFPDFAGNLSSPNTFSNNLLNNLGALQGIKPHIRVGGNTQDYYLYNATLNTSLIGIINPARATDYPTTITIGPSYFESYATWENVKYTHGFNLGLGGNNSIGWESLLATVPLACKALEGGKLLAWEYGNEPDLYSTSAQGAVRPPSWNEAWYVRQWLNGTRHIHEQIERHCPDLAGEERYGYLAPSFAGLTNHLDPLKTWELGLDVDRDIKLYSSHNYIGGATQPGVTLQGTLMNHTKTVASVESQVALMNALASNNVTNDTVPFVLGEGNSLYNEGAPGLSNSFGAALWGLDFNLYAASAGIKAFFMHQGTGYRYAAWMPIESISTTKGTKAPYYGNIAVTAFLGNTSATKTQIVSIPLENSYEAAYASYNDGKLAKIAVLNMREYNYTVNGTSDVVNPVTRGSLRYTFGGLLSGGNGTVKVQRLMANGSDALSGVTWDGWSYNYELDEGKPVRLGNVTVGEMVKVDAGSVAVDVLDSSAVVLSF